MKNLIRCLLLTAFLLAGCTGTPASSETATASQQTLSGKVTFAGSTTMQPLVSKLAEKYNQSNPNVNLDISAGGTTVGISAMHDGTADIGMASRSLTDDEAKGIQQYQIAIDVLAIIVHTDNPVKTLTLAQLQDIYAGKITNWKDLGGIDQAIIPIQREVSSGSRSAFDELALNKKEAEAPLLETTVTAGDMAARVSAEEGAIGYVGFGNLDNTVKLIAVNNVEPTQVTAKDGSYPLVRPLILMTGPLTLPLAQSFIDYALSTAGQQYIQELGWIPMK